MRQLLLIAARNLLQHKRRSSMLGGAILSVTVLLVLLTSVSNGIQETMLRAATTMSTGHVNVGGFFKVTSGQAAPTVTDYKKVMSVVRRHLRQPALVVDRLRGWGKMVSSAGSIQAGISGVDVDQERGLKDVLRIVSGKLVDMKRSHSLMLFAKQAKKLGVRVGDSLTISAPTVRGANNAIDVTVVAIAKDMGFLSSFNVFVPKQAVRELYLMNNDTTGAIQIYLSEPDRSDFVAERLRLEMRKSGYRMMAPLADPFWKKFPVVTREAWTGQKLDVTTWKDELSMLTWIITAFNAVTVGITGILLVIIVVGVMNTLWMSIRERTREIGTLRAIGMSRRRVLVMFVMEAALLSLVATGAGAVLGAGLARLLDAAHISLNEGFTIFLMSDTLRLAVSETALVASPLIISTIMTLFSLFPAYRAANKSPVSALQHAG